MKFLFICPAFPPNRNAIGEYVFNLGKSLLTNDHQVVILTSTNNKESDLKSIIFYHSFDNSITLNKDCINVFSIITLWSKDFEEFLSKISILFEPDIISLQYEPYSYHRKGLPFFLIQRLSKSFKSKLTITFHEIYSRNYLFGNVLNYFIAQFQIFIARRLVVHSFISFTALDLYRKTLNSDNKVVKLFIGSNINFPPTEVELNSINLNTSNATIICFGNKNFTPILLVAKYLKNINFEFSISIVGDIGEKYQSLLNNEILQLRLENSVFILGYRSEEEVETLFNKSSFFIDTNYLDSKKHGGTTLKSGSLATAIKYGKIIIGFRGDMTDSLLEHGNNIWFCEDSSPKHIALAVKDLSANPTLMKYIQANTLKFYFDYLDWEILTKKYTRSILQKKIDL